MRITKRVAEEMAKKLPETAWPAIAARFAKDPVQLDLFTDWTIAARAARKGGMSREPAVAPFAQRQRRPPLGSRRRLTARACRRTLTWARRGYVVRCSTARKALHCRHFPRQVLLHVAVLLQARFGWDPPYASGAPGSPPTPRPH